MKEIASILLVDDEPAILEFVMRALEAAGYRVLTARDGLEALAVLKSQPVDLILADITMPRMNGYQLYERVLENPHWVAIPFLFLTARVQDSDVRYGKELGVDDYLIKPFTLDDLLAVVRGRLRRAQLLAGLYAHRTLRPNPASQVLAFGRLRIDSKQHRVWQNGQQIRLSAREFKLLECLARRADQVVPLKELIQVTHDLDTNGAEAGILLRPLVRSLRRKMGYPAGETGCIESVRGVGYQLVQTND